MKGSGYCTQTLSWLMGYSTMIWIESFHTPKKDQCDQCETVINADKEGKQKLVDDFHLKEKQLSRKEKEFDKIIANGIKVAVYDLQAVFITNITRTNFVFLL